MSKTVYPADGPQPAASNGGKIVKVSFPHQPGAYTSPNQLHWNTFDDGIAKCAPPGPRVVDDHIFVSPLLGYVNPGDNKCGSGRGNIMSAPALFFMPTSAAPQRRSQRRLRKREKTRGFFPIVAALNFN